MKYASGKQILKGTVDRGFTVLWRKVINIKYLYKEIV
jgi:hypothetical protein